MKIGGANVCLLVVLALGMAIRAGAGDKHAAYAVVAGIVFQESGFALPGAQVQLKVKTQPQGVKAPKPQKAVSDARGEFAFHVPAGKAEYALSVQAAGFVGEQRTASVSADERVDVYFQLKAVK